MPIFEYNCRKCGADFELLVRNSEERVKCPECGAGKVERKLSVFAPGATSPASKCGSGDICPGAGSHQCSAGHCAHSH